MYVYDEFDETLVRERVAQFADQVARRLDGRLSEDEFKPLRLQNGVYLQLHAYMLRIAIPYGQLSPPKLRQLAAIARRWDRGSGHFTTRQNLQFNWIALADVPDILSALADVGMHAIQTSGNCIRNVTTDHFAGAAPDEIDDPRAWCEILRQWSTFHPEFAFLPRKFKIAVNAAAEDRAAIRVHDIGLERVRLSGGGLGFDVWVGGGLGRTPHVGHCIRAGVGDGELLDYLESVLRVYNRHGRRDNKFKARIKILLNELGIEAFTAEVEAEFAARTAGERIALPQAEIERIRAFFAMPELTPTAHTPAYDTALAVRPAFARWARQNTFAHKVAGHAMVLISLKAPGDVPGDATAHQMEVVADLAERFGHGDIRVSHEQNLALPHVRREDLPVIFDTLQAAGLASANAGMITDIICCPGLDFCNLANTRSIPLAQEIALAFDGEMARTLGEVSLNMSGCINACGHHHVGHIGLLGVDRKGEEAYQISLGGRSDRNARIGEITGPALARAEVVPALRRVLDTYLSVRERAGERFIDTLERLGETPFREAIHADHPAHS